MTITHCGKECQNKMPRLSLQIGSHVYLIRPQSYLRVVSPTPVILFEDKKLYRLFDYCTFRIFPTHKKQWILGSPFLNDFY